MKTTRTILLSLAMALPALAASAHTAPSARYGMPSAGDYADQTVKVDGSTRYVNVSNGQTVRFVVGAQSFSYTFNAYANVGALELSDIAPKGVTVPAVRVYVAPNPLYQG